MAGKNKNSGKKKKGGLLSTDAIVAVNKRARYDYALEDVFEAGIMLVGTEVKSLRMGQANIQEAYVGPKGDEIWLFNANIPEYQQASQLLQHDPKRARQLLLKKREIHKLMGSVSREGYSIVPMKLFFNERGLAKLEIALGKGKKMHDKRESEKNKSWAKNKARILREKG